MNQNIYLHLESGELVAVEKFERELDEGWFYCRAVKGGAIYHCHKRDLYVSATLLDILAEDLERLESAES